MKTKENLKRLDFVFAKSSAESGNIALIRRGKR